MNKSNKWLLISLLMNVLFLGIILGGMSHRYSHHWQQSSMSELSTEQRQAVKTLLKDIRSHNKALHQDIREKRKSLMATLSAETFDTKSYLLQTEQLSVLKQQMMTNMTTAIAQNAEGMTQAEREALAKMLKYKHKKHRRH